MKPLRRCLIACLMLLVGACASAQEDDSPLGENDAGAPAVLSLTFDHQGGLQASLSLPRSATKSDALPTLLAQSLHCPQQALGRPDSSEHDFPDLQENWSAARRERYRKQMADFNRRLLSGRCSQALVRHDQLLSGDFDFTAVIPELQRIGVDQLSVYVVTPQAQFREYTQTNLVHDPVIQSNSLLYRIPVEENSKPLSLHLAYGFRAVDLHQAIAILAGFIVLPVLMTLWMRRRALTLAKVDAAAAWFGFSRALNWVVLGTSLLWLTSGFGARQRLQDWFGSQGFSVWPAAVIDIAIAIIPAWLPYFLCIALTYPVHKQLRGTQWTRREFLLRQWVLLGATALPLMILLCAVGLMKDRPEFAVGLFFLSFLVLQTLQFVKFRITKELPQPLTTGELRDRIFGMAGRLGVSVQQIFILPAGKGQIANAYAAGNRIVMFTDYLLEHLNKREVDGIAAHELAHLRHKHPGSRVLVFLAAIFLPLYFTWLTRAVTGLAASPAEFLAGSAGGAKLVSAWWKAMSIFEHWSQRDFFLLMVGLSGFYFFSRYCENVADAAAVRLTGDAEAQITGLLKVSRLNLIPIRWGKMSESWLTHPSTVRRAHRMARVGGLAPGRLQEILREYDSQGSTPKVAPPENRYVVPQASDPEKVRVALRNRTRAQGKLWLNLAVYVVPIALISLLIRRMHWSASVEALAYFGGIAIVSVLVTLSGVWLGESGKGREKRRLIQHFEREYVPAGQPEDIVVGFAPGPHPRIYGTQYHWDIGFLILSKDRLQFVGEQVKFSFTRSEIDGVVIARGGPGWWKFERIYIRWKIVDGQNGIFNLNSLEPGSVWHSNEQVRALYQEIEQWRQQSMQYLEVRPELAGLKKLDLGQVTSISPAKLGSFAMNLRVLFLLVPMAMGVSMLVHAEMWYLIASMLALRLVQSIPYWRYRDRVPAFSGRFETTPKARSAVQA